MPTKAQTSAAAVAASVVVGAGVGVGLTLKNEEATELIDDTAQTEDVSSSIVEEEPETPMPSFTVLSLEIGFDSEYFEQSDKNNRTMGWLLGGYLVGTYGAEKRDHNTIDNEAWWNWSYKRLKKDLSGSKNLSEEFGDDSVESAFSLKESSDENSSRALNRVCEDVYRKKLVDFGFISPSGEQQSDLIRDLIKYCSPLEQKPKTIEDKNEEDQIGAFWNSSNSYLISVNDESNNVFWKLRNDDFFRNNKNFWSGAALDDKDHPLFHDLYSKKDDNPKSVKEVCKAAYSWAEKDDYTSNDDDVLKFCSWSYSIYLGSSD